MKISVLLAFVLAPVVVMTFTSCASAPDDGAGRDYPEPNRADHAAKLQDSHSKYIRTLTRAKTL